MKIEIFESAADRGALDSYIIRMKKEYPDCVIRKIDITNTEEMKQHTDVISVLRGKGIDALPIVKIDGVIKGVQDKRN